MIKKMVSILAATTLLSSSLIGCSSSSSATQDTKVTEQGEGDVSTTEGGKKQELLMWVGPDGLNDYEQSYVDKYNETNEKAYIKAITTPEGRSGELMAAMMAGTAPDILILSYPEMESFIYSDAIIPLNTQFEEWDDMQNMNQDMLDQFKINEEYYGLTCGEYAMGMFYNKQHFADAGIEIPTTWNWEDFVGISKKLTNAETGQYGFALNWNQWAEWWFQMFVWAAGGDLTVAEPDGKLKTTFTDPAVIEAGNFYRTLKAENCIQSDMSLSLDGLQQEFAAGKASIIYSGLDSMEKFISMGMSPEDIGVLPIPEGPGGTNATQLGGSCYVIHSKVPEEKIEAVFDYYEMVSSKEYYEGKAEYFKEQGLNLLTGAVRTDLDMDVILEGVPEDIKTTLMNASGNGHLEFYGKNVVGTFVDQAVQKIFVDESLDIEQVFKEFEAEANKQVVPQYNEAFQ